MNFFFMVIINMNVVITAKIKMVKLEMVKLTINKINMAKVTNE